MISARILLDSKNPYLDVRLTTFELTYPRFVHAELMTHRLFCLAGDSVLEFDLPSRQNSGARRVYRMTLTEFVTKWLHGSRPHRSRWGTERTYDLKPRMRAMRIRQLNEATGDIQTATVVNAVESGTKPVYEVSAGKYRVAGSADHRVLTSDGWKTIGEIRVGDELVVRTLKRPEELRADPLRLKKIEGRWRSAWQIQQRKRLQEADVYCRGCRQSPGVDIHHVVPVHERPELAFSEDNITLLCDACHQVHHEKQGWQTGNPLYSGTVTVDTIRYRGIEPTYDLEISGPFPNFLANGVVVHNSRNAASSRAIPAEKVVALVEAHPAEPVWWGRNQAGMQAREELVSPMLEEAQRLWRLAREGAVSFVRSLHAVGLHKQLANRILEPWMPITTIVSATHWRNFMALRFHPDAQPELARLASLVYEAYRESTPTPPNVERWHAPLLPDLEELRSVYSAEEILRISIGRVARISYLTHDGRRDPQADLDLARRLQESGHMSPFEHVAQAFDGDEWEGISARTYQAWRDSGVPVGNFWGWGQYRKLLANEHAFPRPDLDLSDVYF